jgi:hypothetical protein
VDARQTWQALQSRLTSARAAVDAGDRPRALAEIAAALEIDPNFLAAHLLREGILAAPDVAQVAPIPPSAIAQPETSSPQETSAHREPAAPPETSATHPTPSVNASANRYVNFEPGAKHRRVQRRLEAARAALEREPLKPAAPAPDEVGEPDPNPSELLPLTPKLDAPQFGSGNHRGPQLVAAAVFVVSLLGASLLHDSTSLMSRSMIVAAPLVSELTPIVSVPPEITPVGTTGDLAPVRKEEIQPVTVEPANRLIVESPAATRAPAPVDSPEILLEPAPAAMPAPRLLGSVQESAVVAPVSLPLPPPAAALADDNLLVKQALQRYRTAYEGLDAQSAHAIWPAVNQAALARAFDGLESQSLTFDACDVRVRGESATATCQGSARYVPKIGSREPRIEPRVWNFLLHKAGDDWKIENARAER